MVAWRALVVLLGLLALAPAARGQQPAPPGQFDYYLLALSWSPAYCLAHRDDPRAKAECSRRRGFVVHGLWPQNEDGTWPEHCRPVPPVPPELAAHEAAIMPNDFMVRHEWEKHGSCTDFTAQAYFDALDRAFARLRLPTALVEPREPFPLPLAEAKRLFMAANPGLGGDMFAMRCTHGGEVDEVRLCLDKGFQYRPCGRGAGDSCPIDMHFDPIPDAPE
jgi:ribonuclease T2